MDIYHAAIRMSIYLKGSNKETCSSTSRIDLVLYLSYALLHDLCGRMRPISNSHWQSLRFDINLEHHFMEQCRQYKLEEKSKHEW